MSFVDTIKRVWNSPPAQLFKSTAAQAAPKPPQSEAAWATPSLIYSNKDFPKYNPDALIRNKGTAVYRKMMMDDQVKAVSHFKRNAIISRKYKFDIDVDEETGEENKEHRKMSDFFHYTLDNIKGSFKDSLNGMLTGLQNGFSITEKIFAPVQFEGKTMWGISDLKLKPYDTFEFKVDEYGNVVALNQLQGATLKKIPMSKVIHFVHQPDVDEHYGSSDLRACYRNWWSKDMIIKFMNIHLERHAGGFVFAKVDGNLGNAERSYLEQLMQNITASTSAIIPHNVELDKIMPTNTDSFEKAIILHNLGIARSQLVPNLLGLSDQKNVGSYAQSQTQMEAFFWILSAIAVRLEEVINEQLFKELALWNFGTDIFPRFKFEPVSDFMKLEISKAWSELVNKGAVTKTDTDERYLRDILDFPKKGEVDEADLQPPAPDVPPDPNAPPDPKDKGLKKKFEERPWLKRVNFEALARKWETHDTTLVRAMTSIMADVKRDMDRQVIRMAGQRSMGFVKVIELDDLHIRPKYLTLLRKTIRNHLKAGLNAAHNDAQGNMPKAFGEMIPAGMDMVQADKYLSRATMKITGVLETKVLEDVRVVLSNGITYDWTLRQSIQAMENHTGLLSVLPKIDSAGRVINIPHRLENIARTNMSQAWNKGRTAYFNRADVRDFIQAFEYSAILDDRTTPICQHLDGRIIKDFAHYAPPNHYMCRSILVPITKIDKWNGQVDGFPEIQPLSGFGGEGVLPPIDITPSIKVSFGGVSEVTRKAVEGGLNKVSPRIHDALNAHGVTAHVAETAKQARPYVQTNQHTAIYYWAKKDIIVAEKYRRKYNGMVANTAVDHGAVHETGHAFDHYLGARGAVVTDAKGFQAYSLTDKDFIAAYKKDITALSPEKKKIYSYYRGKKGYDRKLEVFAETFKYLHMGDRPAHWNYQWGTDFANVTKHVEGLIKEWQ